MNSFNITLPAILALASGCASVPPPTQQMADVQSANRSAQELGARENPQAQLHLKLAEEQLQQAKAAMEEDDNEGANRLLMRAKADAELAIALTREEDAVGHADKASASKAASEPVNPMRNTQ
jgi:hypothetical protein